MPCCQDQELEKDTVELIKNISNTFESELRAIAEKHGAVSVSVKLKF